MHSMLPNHRACGIDDPSSTFSTVSLLFQAIMLNPNAYHITNASMCMYILPYLPIGNEINKCMCNFLSWIQYSWKIWRGIKFGGLAVYITTAKLKSAKISYLHIYVWRSRTKPPNLNQLVNIIAIAILGSTAKFNSCQYFWLYGTL